MALLVLKPVIIPRKLGKWKCYFSHIQETGNNQTMPFLTKTDDKP